MGDRRRLSHTLPDDEMASNPSSPGDDLYRRTPSTKTSPGDELYRRTPSTKTSPGDDLYRRTPSTKTSPGDDLYRSTPSTKTSPEEYKSRVFNPRVEAKTRQDLFTLSRSPFEEAQPISVRRRVQGAGQVASGATESLVNARNLLLETVKSGDATVRSLGGASSLIQVTRSDLTEQNTLIAQSKKLLGKYGRREGTDKILICLAVLFFLAVVVYVVRKRLF